MTRENVRDKRIPPAMLEREIKELARKIAKLRIADLKSSSGPREFLPNYREGKLVLSDSFAGNYFLLNELYLCVISRVSSNSFVGDVELQRVKRIIINLCRGVEVTVPLIVKRYGDLVIALTNVLDGVDVSGVDYASSNKSLVNDLNDELESQIVSVHEVKKDSLLQQLSMEDVRYREKAFAVQYLSPEARSEKKSGILDDLKSRQDHSCMSEPTLQSFHKVFSTDAYDIAKKAENETRRKTVEKGALKKMDHHFTSST